MKFNDRVITLEDWEHNIVIRALNDFKNNTKTDVERMTINELLLKIIEAPEKKIMNKVRREKPNER